uniref:EGF-like domain-containing protein n=1 Tax=Trichuris muris TaxID=70415 RepID=A0A5S6QM50_TRIMR
MAIVWCLRHGERQDYVDASWVRTAASPDDTPLAAKGHLQAFEAAQRLQKEKIHHIFSSPFLRCVQTANYVADAMGLTIKIEHGLSEVLNIFPPGHKKIDELRSQFANVDRSYTSFVVPNAVEHHDFDCFGRVGAAVSKIVDNYVSDQDASSILLVGHGASIAGITKHLTGHVRYVGLCTLTNFELEQGSACVDDFCFNEGTCYTPKGKNQPFCQCESGFWGARCQHKAGDKPCFEHRCANYGVCDSDGFTRDGKHLHHYACRCVNEFTGPFCTLDKLDMMCKHQKSCNNHSTMVVKNGQCHCQCKPEYTGKNCEKPLPCAWLHCEHGSKCDNKRGRCDCRGTYYTGARCETIARGKLPPYAKEFCRGDKMLHCQHGAQCTIGTGLSGNVTAYCNCSRKWNGDRLCSKEYDPCEPTAFERECSKDYLKCKLDRPPQNERCLNNGTCQSNETISAGRTFRCRCKKGYLGMICETKDPCEAKSPCRTSKHICQTIASTDGNGIQKRCSCNGSFTGVFCERRVTTGMLKKICRKSKCQNNSTCIPCIKLPGVCKTREEHKRKYICACDPRQSGEFCQHQINPCRFHTCRNKAQCEKIDDYMYKCICKAGVIGLHCQIILDICELRSPCGVGECVLDSNNSYGYHCKCPAGYRGWQCELPSFNFFGYFDMTRSTYVALWTSVSAVLLAIPLQAVHMQLDIAKSKKSTRSNRRHSERKEDWKDFEESIDLMEVRSDKNAPRQSEENGRQM